jgi:hypothetical protein
MRSIFLDYYIGSLLLWKGKPENFTALSCEPVYGYQGTGKPEYIVLDGQQRLTAIYYAFLAPDVPLPNRTNRFFYFVHVDKFMAEEYDEAFGYEWLTRRWVKVLANRETQYATHLFPFSVIGATGWELPNWVQGYEAYWNAKVATAKTAGDTDAAKVAQNHAFNAKRVWRASPRHYGPVSNLLHRTGQRPRSRQGLRHFHPNQQPGRPS